MSSEAVLSSPDVVALVLSHVGPATFGVASLVCWTWHRVCRSDEPLLLTVMRGGLTKTTLMHLLVLTSQQADALPHTTHRRLRGGHYHLYDERAVAASGGIEAWRARLQTRRCLVVRQKRRRVHNHTQYHKRAVILPL